MKLFVPHCKVCNQKLYLNIKAYSRTQLRQHFHRSNVTVLCNHCHHKSIYEVNQIYAEKEYSATISTGLAGSLLGLIGGPLGALIGGGVGAIIGNNTDDEENSKVEFFNRSR